MNNWKYSVFAILLYSVFVFSQIEEEDYLTSAYLSSEEYEGFKTRVGKAVVKHPEFKSAQQLLIAAYADTKISKSGLLPQVKFLIDSSNALDRKYANTNNNLVERSQSDHKTNMKLSISQKHL